MGYEYYGSDEMMAVYMPVVTFWVAAGIYEMVAHLRPDARLHPKEEEEAKNIPSRRKVVMYALFQQALQSLIIVLFHKPSGGDEGTPRQQQQPLPVVALQLFAAMAIFDTMQYFVHRYMHISKFWYNNFHSVHHSLIVPYPSGALYSSMFDGFVFDTVGGVLATRLPGLSARATMYFFCLAGIKTVDIHSGLWLPWSPAHVLFGNTSAFHDAHHQLKGHRYNFSQPFFVAWDKILGTYMPYSVEKRKEGGYELRMLKD